MKILRYILAIPLGIVLGAVMQFLATYLFVYVLSFFIPDFLSDFTHIKSWFPFLIGGYCGVSSTALIAPSKKILFGIITFVLSIIAIVYNSIMLEWDNNYIAYIIGGGIGIFSCFSEE